MYMTARVVENRPLARGNFVLRLSLPDDGAQLASALPGQFVMLRGEWGRDPLLPRAFSILRLCDGGCEILVKAIGRGTRLLQLALEGAPMSVLGPLGRPFVDGTAGDWLVAGGVGLAPLLWFAEKYPRAQHQMLYGARTAEDLVLLDELRAAGCGARLDHRGRLGAGRPRGHARPRHRRARHADAAALVAKHARAHLRAERDDARGGRASRARTTCPAWCRSRARWPCGIGVCLGCALPLTDTARAARARSPTPASTGRCSTRPRW